jgi:hypothetical protein
MENKEDRAISKIKGVLKNGLDKLWKDEDGAYNVYIRDGEEDIIQCRFDNDGCVHLCAEEYTFLTLSSENLEHLENLMCNAEILYLNESEDDETKS